MDKESLKLIEQYLPKLEANGRELIALGTQRVVTLATAEVVVGIITLMIAVFTYLFARARWKTWSESSDRYSSSDSWQQGVSIGAIILCIIASFILIPDGLVGLTNPTFYAIKSLLP
jgi:hypothetical protein